MSTPPWTAMEVVAMEATVMEMLRVVRMEEMVMEMPRVVRMARTTSRAKMETKLAPIGDEQGFQCSRLTYFSYFFLIN